MENLDYALVCNNVVKKYGEQRALDGLTLNVRKGDIYGFVGENGSGKTTIIRAICGLIKINEGSISVFGIDTKDPKISLARKKIGAIVESPSIYLDMSLKDNLKCQALILGYKLSKEESDKLYREIANEVGLLEYYDSKKKVKNFSLGMRQRLGIAMALLAKPELLILDEPMNGLDPQGIVAMRNLILNLNGRGITFLISSHILSELSLIATKYGIISKGHTIKEVTKEELESECKKSLIITTPDAVKAYDLLVEKYTVKLAPNTVVIEDDVQSSEIAKILVNNDITIEGITTKTSNIEEYYLSLIGGKNNA